MKTQVAVRRGLRNYQGLWQGTASEGPSETLDPLVQKPLAPERLGEELLKQPILGLGEHLRLWLPWSSLNWSAWAHARIFALACYGSFEIPEEALRRLRGPLAGLYYRKSSLALVLMLNHIEPRSQKSGWLRRLCCLPPLFVWAFERQLHRAIRARLIAGG